MLLRLFFLFTLLPLVELAILVWIHSVTNWWVTLGLLFLPGVLGVWLVRHQGLRCLQEVRRQIARGEPPAAPLMDGLLILVAAVLLVTPGVLSDLIGLALLIPPVRGVIRRYVTRRISQRVVTAVRDRLQIPPAEGGTAEDGS